MLWHGFREPLPAVRADRSADAAVVSAVKPGEVGLFVAVAGGSVEDLVPGSAGRPGRPRKGAGRTGIHASGAGPAKGAGNRGPAGERHVGEDGAQTDPGAERAGDKLAVTADPADARSGGGGFVGKVPPDGLQVGPFGCGQRPGGVPVALDFLSQSHGKVVDPLVEPLVLSGVGRGRAGFKLGHDLGRHRKREGDGPGKRSAGWSQGRDKRGEVGGAEKRNFLSMAPFGDQLSLER